MGKIEPSSLSRSWSSGPLIPRYPDVEEDAAGFNFARQSIKQLLGRGIGYDFIASLL